MLTFVGGKSLGTFNYGQDKVRLPPKFAEYLIGWILEWDRKGLLKRKTTKVKHTDLYAQILEAMQGHVVTFTQPVVTDEVKIMERCKVAAKQTKRSGPWGEDINEFDSL